MASFQQMTACCTARLMFGLDNPWGSTPPEEFKNKLKNQIYDQAKDYAPQAVIMAITTQRQNLAEQVFTECKFEKCGPYGKSQHPDTRITVWVKHIDKILHEDKVLFFDVEAMKKEEEERKKQAEKRAAQLRKERIKRRFRDEFDKANPPTVYNYNDYKNWAQFRKEEVDRLGKRKKYAADKYEEYIAVHPNEV